MLCNDYDVIIAGERLENGARLELLSQVAFNRLTVTRIVVLLGSVISAVGLWPSLLPAGVWRPRFPQWQARWA